MIPMLANLDELSIFVGSDQLETCRKCGSRTVFDDVDARLQLHKCILCGNQYLVEFDDESPDKSPLISLIS
jgi:hypothetical protein